MGELLDTHNLPKLTQEGTENLKILISVKEIVSITTILTRKKTPG